MKFIFPNPPFPSVNSQSDPQVNADGSVDVYFSADPPKGKKNWVQINPDNGWYPMIRFYGPLKAYTDKTWKPDDVVLVK